MLFTESHNPVPPPLTASEGSWAFVNRSQEGAGVHPLMKEKGMILKPACPFTGLLSEHFYTVCFSVGVPDALQMMSHSRARVNPAQTLPLLPECGPGLLEESWLFLLDFSLTSLLIGCS